MIMMIIYKITIFRYMEALKIVKEFRMKYLWSIYANICEKVLETTFANIPKNKCRSCEFFSIFLFLESFTFDSGFLTSYVSEISGQKYMFALYEREIRRKHK